MAELGVGLPYLADSYNAKMVCFGEGAMELCMREKAVFFLSVNILTVWSAGFLGCKTHGMILMTYLLYIP